MLHFVIGTIVIYLLVYQFFLFGRSWEKMRNAKETTLSVSVWPAFLCIALLIILIIL